MNTIAVTAVLLVLYFGISLAALKGILLRTKNLAICDIIVLALPLETLKHAIGKEHAV